MDDPGDVLASVTLAIVCGLLEDETRQQKALSEIANILAAASKQPGEHGTIYARISDILTNGGLLINSGGPLQ